MHCTTVEVVIISSAEAQIPETNDTPLPKDLCALLAVRAIVQENRAVILAPSTDNGSGHPGRSSIISTRFTIPFPPLFQ